MIQRIQSLYLLIAAIVSAMAAVLSHLMTFGGHCDIANYIAVNTLYSIFLSYYYIIALLAACLLSLVSLFSFHNRHRQINIIRAPLSSVLVLTIILSIIMYFYCPMSIYVLLLCASLPLIALIFNLLALHAIRSDERKVKAADRIR